VPAGAVGLRGGPREPPREGCSEADDKEGRDDEEGRDKGEVDPQAAFIN
jgi:hypothetical protein